MFNFMLCSVHHLLNSGNNVVTSRKNEVKCHYPLHTTTVADILVH
jgi:hypothetical protein